MKKKLTIALMMVAGLMACTSEEDGEQRLSNDGTIRFVPQMVSDWNAPWTTRAEAENSTTVQALQGADGLYLHSTVSKSFYKSTANDITRGTKYLGVDDGDGGKTFAEAEKFYVSGYRYGSNETVNSVNSANFLSNAPIINSGGQWRATNQSYVMPAATDKIDFFAWFVADEETAGVTAINAAGGLQLTYTVPTDINNQPDLLAAVTRDETFDSQESYTVPLAFSHQLTAVNFVLDENVAPGTITEIAFLHVFTTATLSVGGLWDTTHGNAPNETAYATDFATVDNDVLRSGETLIANLMMIPQLFTENNQQIRIKITIDDSEKTLYANLKGTRWEPSSTVTYKISTSAVNVLRISDVTYPTSWSAASTENSDIKSAYTDGDEIGVFGVDATGHVLFANKKYTLNGTNWVPEEGVRSLYVPGATFYAYYPYQSTLSGAPVESNENTVLIDNALPTATEFFSSVISNWTPVENQSTAALLNAQDLQIGQSTTGAASTVSFPMTHTMGLTSLTLESKSLATTRYFEVQNDNSVSETSYFDIGTSPVTAAHDFEQYGNMLANENKLYYVMKHGQDMTVTSNNTGNERWKESSITLTAAANTFRDYTAELARTYLYKGWSYSYRGKGQTFTPPVNGDYRIECWGAEGGDRANSHIGGRGGYVSGLITLPIRAYYVYVGGAGARVYGSSSGTGGGWNGGGNGVNNHDAINRSGGGGGATDIRLEEGTSWNDFASLKSRIMVAAGGGGACMSDGGNGGGLTGYRAEAANGYPQYNGSGGTQTAGATCTPGGYGSTSSSFGIGSVGLSIGGGGGGGYYGGSGGTRSGPQDGSGGGGSSFISGHTGCNAVGSDATASNRAHTNQPNHYSGYVFTHTKMVDGSGYEWTTTAGTTKVGVPKTTEDGHESGGHTGNGFCRIAATFLIDE